MRRKTKQPASDPGTLIYMIHGMWGNAGVWDAYRLSYEKAGYTCVVPTLRHHDLTPGREPSTAQGTTSLLDYAADLEAEIRQLPEKPIIIGHSMGGLLAQMLAARGLCRAVILLNPASPWGIFSLYPSVLVIFLGYLLRWGFWRKTHKPGYYSASFCLLNRITPRSRREIYQTFTYEQGRAIADVGLRWLDRSKSSHVDESKVKCPMLVVGGRQDNITPARGVRKVAAKYKEVSHYVEYPELAHWCLGEKGWEEIVQMSTQWLKGHRGA